MRNLVTNKLFLAIAAFVLLVVLMVSTSSPGGGLNVLRNVVRVPLAPLQQAYTFLTGKAGGLVSDISNMGRALDENVTLRARIRDLENKNLELEELKRQNGEFRKLLNFKEQYADYGFLGGTIIGKDAGNWFDVFTIDRGIKDGLRQGKGYPVISADGLVGRVSNVELLSSDVISLIDMDSTVSVRVARTRDLLVVRGDITLKQEGLCRVDYIPPNADLVPGDVLETSGMGDVYPKGIRVGVVDRIIRNQGQFDAYAILKPAVDFKRLEEVEVLTPSLPVESDAAVGSDENGTGSDENGTADADGLRTDANGSETTGSGAEGAGTP